MLATCVSTPVIAVLASDDNPNGPSGVDDDDASSSFPEIARMQDEMMRRWANVPPVTPHFSVEVAGGFATLI
jgi:hypothetical protein